MIRSFSYLISIILFCIGCTDKSYTGLNVEIDYGDNMPVRVAVGGQNDLNIKGSGLMDGTNPYEWEGAEIYVYAFRRSADVSFAITSKQNPYSCLVDASQDSNGNLKGKKAILNNYETYLTWVDSRADHYYPMNNSIYDFYAYYVDDCEVLNRNVARGADNVSLKIEVDGSQDLMTSVGGLVESQLNRGDLSEYDLNYIKNYAFNYGTAQRNIHPVLIFKHDLVRLSFEMYPGSDKANNITLKGLYAFTQAEGNYVVAHKDTSKIGFYVDRDAPESSLYLTEEDGSELNEYKLDYSGGYDGPVYSRPSIMVGGSLFLPPDDNYAVYARLEEKREFETASYNNRLEVALNNGSFLPGNHYCVRMAIYGMKAVVVDVSLVSWEYKGNIIVDSEDDW